MPLVISDDLVRASHLTTNEIKQELAITLFQKEKLTLGQASALAEMGQYEFQMLLGSRKIPAHYDSSDYFDDLKTISKLGL
jgi:predicted HTH domain antitoxin